MPVLLALLWALASSVDLVLQRDSSRAAPAHVRGRRLAGYLVRNPRWLLGQAAWVAAFALQALALHGGRLSVVQPVLVAQLVFTLLIRRFVTRWHVRAAAWASAGLSAMLTDWPVYALVAVGALTTVLVQTALHVGPLTVSQPLLVVVNPLTSIALSIWLFGEHFSHDPAAIAEGQSFSAIVQSTRARLVAHYLANERYSLTEISGLLGFATPSAFSTWFRQHFGSSASEWRARTRNVLAIDSDVPAEVGRRG